MDISLIIIYLQRNNIPQGVYRTLLISTIVDELSSFAFFLSLQNPFNFYYCRYTPQRHQDECVYRTLLISTIVDMYSLMTSNCVYRTLLISTIVDNERQIKVLTSLQNPFNFYYCRLYRFQRRNRRLQNPFNFYYCRSQYSRRLSAGRSIEPF